MKRKNNFSKSIKLAAIVCCLVTFFLCSLSLKAEDSSEVSRPVTGIYSLEWGREQVLCTYLSPLKYKGAMFGINGQWTKAMPFDPESVIMMFEGRGHFSNLFNPARTAQMIGLTGTFRWGMEWRRRLPLDFQITAGGGLGIEGGAYYLLRNSNNPVQALTNVSLDIRASVSKHFMIGKLPVLITERINIPSVGAFFCPEYGETYYEIYLGNRKGLAHAGWWGNNFRIENMLNVILDFGRTAMSIGYRFEAYMQWSNNINTKIYSNSLVIGVIPGGIGLKKPSRTLPETKIYSLY